MTIKLRIYDLETSKITEEEIIENAEMNYHIPLLKEGRCIDGMKITKINCLLGKDLEITVIGKKKECLKESENSKKE